MQGFFVERVVPVMADFPLSLMFFAWSISSTGINGINAENGEWVKCS